MTQAPTTIRLDDDVREAMEALKDKDGIPLNVQANKALRAWLTEKGEIKPKKK